MFEILLGVALFSVILLALVFIILGAKSMLVASGSVDVLINGEKTIQTPVGSKLLGALAESDLFVASACGGGGTCGQCRVQVLEGGGSILPTETSLINKREAAAGDRLSCQLTVKQNMRIQVPDEVFSSTASSRLRSAFARTGIALIYGRLNRVLRNRSCAPIRWPTTRRRPAS